jgi:hypothetical protein
MTTKIKVDPRTFKIINLNQTAGQSSQQPEITSNSTSFTSDSESSTSVNSQDEIKVIKLDNPEQIGGRGQPINTQDQAPQIVSSVDLKPASTITEQPKTENKNDNNLFKYLSINNNTKSTIEESDKLNKLEESNNSINSKETEELQTEEVQIEEVQTEKQNEQKQQEESSTPDVFDLTQNKLYQVLSKFFEDVNGDGIGINLHKMTKLFETHNQIMEKMLNQLIIMNTNYKQVKVPDIVQTSTKQAGNIIEFRKKLDQFDSKSQKKD